MMEKESRRVKMTKMLLNESFLHFLAEKPLSRITIKEICEYADVNRSTYYAYYTDPYDQLRKLEAELLIDMSAYIDGITSDDLQDSQRFYQSIKGFLDYIKSKKHSFQVLLGSAGDFNLQKDILTFFAERILEIDFQAGTGDMDSLQEYIFVSNGSFGLIYYWLMDHSEDTTERLAWRITSFTEVFRTR